MSTEKPAILYVADLACLLGRTEAAIRSAVNRGGADWLPPRLETRRLSWRRETVDTFLRGLEKKPKPARMTTAKFQQVLNQTLSQAVQGENVAALQAAISKSLGEIIETPPTTVKLSEFMETIRSGLHKEDHEEFFAQLEVTDYGFAHLSFDSDEKCQSWHGAEYRLGITKDGEVFSLKMRGVEVKRASLPNVIGEMDSLLMSMYVGRTTMQVDMDADDVADAARSKTDY